MRIIAATNRELESAVEAGLFRQDLYYRVNVFPIVLPPLRERKDDILLLADHFVAKYAQKLGKDVRRISTQAINMMAAYHWPGNVRELENCIEYAVLLSRDNVIHGHNLPPTLQMPDADDNSQVDSLKHRVAILEKDMIVDALKSCHGSINAAARRLGITAAHGPLQDQETADRPSAVRPQGQRQGLACESIPLSSLSRSDIWRIMEGGATLIIRPRAASSWQSC